MVKKKLTFGDVKVTDQDRLLYPLLALYNRAYTTLVKLKIEE